MPLIQVTLSEGRTPEQLQALGEALTAAVEGALGADPDTIRVVLTECPSDLWFVGGRSLTEVRRYRAEALQEGVGHEHAGGQ